MGVEGASILNIGKCAHKITANAPEVFPWEYEQVFPFYTIYLISLFLLIGNANKLVLVGEASQDSSVNAAFINDFSSHIKEQTFMCTCQSVY